MSFRTSVGRRFSAGFFVSFAAVAALLLSAACGRQEEKKTGENAGETEREGRQYKIGVSIPAADHGWTGGVVWFAEQGKKKLEAENGDVKVLISSAKDASEQVDKIENLLVQDIDALVVLPQEPGPLTGICERVREKGVKLIVVDRGLEKKIQNLTVAGDNPEFGRVAAEALAKELDGKGNILVMEGVPCVVNTDRVEAFREVMKQYPDIRILESQSAYWDPEKGLKLMENFLQKYNQIDAVWTGDDDVLVGALKAYEESGRKDIKLFIGGGGSKAIIKRILDGDPVVRLTVTYPPRMIEAAMEEALAILKGTSSLPDGDTLLVHAEVVNRENASDHYFPDSAY